MGHTRMTPIAVALLTAAPMLVACGADVGTDNKDNQIQETPDDTADDMVPSPDGPGPAEDAMNDGVTVPPPAEVLTVTAPPEIGIPQIPVSAFMDLMSYGYHEQEYFFEGQASSYAAGDLTMDGKWVLNEANKAPFRTRLYVRLPDDPADFNGTVVVEWLNVSGGADGDPGYMYNHPLALREGWVWIAVSAQQVGVDGGGIAALTGLLGGGMMMESQEGVFGAPLKTFDPERYGTLIHPGDDYSYDIYTQATRLVHGEGTGPDVLEGLKPERVIAYGESQSAGRLTSYVNGVHPIANVFDGYFIHSRGAAGSGFTSNPADLLSAFLGGGTAHHIRADLGVPVFQFQTETDVHGMLAFLPARQPDTDMLRTWEIAGTSHADKYLVDLGGDVAASVGLDCEGANDGPQQFVIRAALRSLDRWIADGTLPPMGDLLEVEALGQPVLDEYGNTLGGVRSPDVDVPIAIYSGSPPADGGTVDLASGNPLSFFCGIFGSTTPFSPEQLMTLYPTHEDYVSMVETSAAAQIAAGFLLEPEADAMIEEAMAAAVPE